jgi:hypothetical protein
MSDCHPDPATVRDFDFSQVEARVLANLQGEAPYESKGFDLYRRSAAEALGIPEDEVTERERQLTKALSFRRLYGTPIEFVGPETDVETEVLRQHVNDVQERLNQQLAQSMAERVREFRVRAVGVAWAVNALPQYPESAPYVVQAPVTLASYDWAPGDLIAVSRYGSGVAVGSEDMGRKARVAGSAPWEGAVKVGIVVPASAPAPPPDKDSLAGMHPEPMDSKHCNACRGDNVHRRGCPVGTPGSRIGE